MFTLARAHQLNRPPSPAAPSSSSTTKSQYNFSAGTLQFRRIPARNDLYHFKRRNWPDPTGFLACGSLSQSNVPVERHKMPTTQDDSKRQAAREVIDILHEISVLLVRYCCPCRSHTGTHSPFLPSFPPSMWEGLVHEKRCREADITCAT